MEHDYHLYIDGTKMPPPAKEGIIDADQIIWSENAGRVANGDFVGDIIAVKKTLQITWGELTYEQYALIQSSISRLGHPFVTVSYWPPSAKNDSQRRTIRCYSEGLTGTIVTYTPQGRIASVTVNLVQK